MLCYLTYITNIGLVFLYSFALISIDLFNYKIQNMKKILLSAMMLYFFTPLMAQNVGIGTNTPVTKLDVAGDLALREGSAIAVSGVDPVVSITLHATNAENSFYQITGSPTGTMTLSSIANGVDGQIITLVNATTIKLKITNNNAASGILTSGALAQFISPSGSITLQYSTTAARWFVTNASGSSLADWIKATTADEPAISTDNQYVTGNIGLGGHVNGLDKTYDFVTNAPLTPLVVVSPGAATALSSPATTGLRLAQPGTSGSKWPVSADFKLGSYATVGANAQSQLDIALGNGAIATPDATIMSILGNGNVGIGTTGPNRTLEVDDPSSNAAYIRIRGGEPVGGYSGLEFSHQSTGNNTTKTAIISDPYNSWKRSDLRFILNSDGNNNDYNIATAADTKMIIKNGGNVGIGTIDPKSKLDVEGGAAIGATYSGTTAAPTNGAIIEGRVGIGTNNPSQKLYVVGETAGDYFQYGGSGIQVYNAEATTAEIRIGAAWGYEGIYSSQNMNIHSGSNSYDISMRIGQTEEMRVARTGEIFGKFRHITVHDYYQNSYYSGNRWMWFLKPGAGDANENVDNRYHEDNMWLVPYPGRIVSIMMSVSNTSSNGGYEISNGRFIFAHHPDLNQSGGCGSGSNFCPVSTADAGQPGQFYVLSGNAAVNNGIGAFSINETPAGVIQWLAEGSNIFQFSKGDKVAIGVNSDYIEDNAYQITVVWEYDIWE